MRDVASSSTHFGRKPARREAVRKDDEYCALCSSAAAAVAISQLQLQLSYYSLIALQAFCFPKCDFWGGPRGGLEKNYSRLAIARHIFRPPHKLCYNSTTANSWYVSPPWSIYSPLRCLLCRWPWPDPNLWSTWLREIAWSVTAELSHRSCYLCVSPGASICGEDWGGPNSFFDPPFFLRLPSPSSPLEVGPLKAARG